MTGIGTINPATSSGFAEGYRPVNIRIYLIVPLTLKMTTDGLSLQYNKSGTTNANSASAALNKWLKNYVSNGSTMHSFRHSIRDRLRAVECPSDIIDQIGGWTTSGVGQSYGEGYPLEVCHRWMMKALG